MNDLEKAKEIADGYSTDSQGIMPIRLVKQEIKQSCLEMAHWKDEQLGWHDAKKEQPPMNEEVIVLTNILNGKELSTPRMICFGHIVDKNICVDYDGWNIPGVAYWMYYKEPK